MTVGVDGVWMGCVYVCCVLCVCVLCSCVHVCCMYCDVCVYMNVCVYENLCVCLNRYTSMIHDYGTNTTRMCTCVCCLLRL